MSAQIENIIANIDDKFDSQFNEKSNSTPKQSQQSQQVKSNNDVINPQKIQSKLQVNQKKPLENTYKKELIKKQPNFIQEASPVKIVKKENNHKIQHLNQQEIDLDEQKDQNIYKSLSNKLQSALKKISVSNHQSKKFNKNNTICILQRFDDHEKKKQKQLEQKRHIQQQKKYFGLKQKPDIDPNSRRIATQTSYKPIYQRFQNIMAEKKKKFQQIQQSKKAKEQQQYQNFMTQYQSHVKLHKQDCRDSQTYFNDMILWKTKLQKQRQQKLKEKQEKSTQGYTFKPLLNQKSIKMLQNKKRIPIQDRQIQKSNSHQILYPFKPKVNKRVKNDI